MQKVKVELVRFTASEGKSLKWRELRTNPHTRKLETVLCYSEYEAVIDTSRLVGEVMEVSIEEYREWYGDNMCCLGVGGL